MLLRRPLAPPAAWDCGPRRLHHAQRSGTRGDGRASRDSPPRSVPRAAMTFVNQRTSRLSWMAARARAGMDRPRPPRLPRGGNRVAPLPARAVATCSAARQAGHEERPLRGPGTILFASPAASRTVRRSRGCVLRPPAATAASRRSRSGTSLWLSSGGRPSPRRTSSRTSCRRSPRPRLRAGARPSTSYALWTGRRSWRWRTGRARSGRARGRGNGRPPSRCSRACATRARPRAPATSAPSSAQCASGVSGC
mmetsp:Transcript_13443/g.42546  ORF Transcript_13443/g.42546 Transcript_13443/m.42546 type:complete len:252 (+) Transcript_13443:121-876(+)